MKIQGKMIIARFQDGMSFEEAELSIQQIFPSVKTHCRDCLAVLRNFREAYRGYLIGRGLFRRPDGTLSGRAAVITVENLRNDEGMCNEVSFEFQAQQVVADFSRFGIVIRSIYSDDWNQNMVVLLTNKACFKEMEVIKMIYDGEPNLFYSDLARRLEEGDFEYGENKSRYVTPTNIDSL